MGRTGGLTGIWGLRVWRRDFRGVFKLRMAFDGGDGWKILWLKLLVYIECFYFWFFFFFF